MDRFATLGALVGLSAPPFWLGLMLLYYLGYKLSLFPLSGTGSPLIWYLILPSFTLGIGGAAWYARMVRTTMLGVLRSPYIEFARLKGMPERTILFRHALRHVLTPVITMLGMDLGYFLGGVLIIESVFGLPGVGRLAYNAIGTLDIPMITGTVLVAAVFMVVMNFLVDIAYTVIDPRVRLSRH
jgi:peptide/nickel transport system permease protein